MHPYIQDGDLVSLRSIPAQNVRLGGMCCLQEQELTCWLSTA